MTRAEIITRFREECPDVTTNVVSNTQLQNWCQVGDKEICAKARLIKGETTITASTSTNAYNLTLNITNFYDIDDFPGGGVVYDGKAISLTTIAELDEITPNWRSNATGIPKRYYRRNQFLYLDRVPSSAVSMIVYAILVSEDFDDDSKLPFNQYTFLEPFHYSMVLYLKKRAKALLEKDESNAYGRAVTEYEDFVKWMKKEVNRGTLHTAQFRPQKGYVNSGYAAYNKR